MSAEETRRRDDPANRLLESFTREQLVEIIVEAAERDDDVARAVRLAAARNGHDLGVLRKEADRAFRTRRFLDYRESMEWARAGRPVVAELERAAADCAFARARRAASAGRRTRHEGHSACR